MDVLLFGGDHRFQAYELEGKFFCNPGSATGAMSTGWLEEGEEVVPSFCLMDVSLFPIAPMRRPNGYLLDMLIGYTGSRRCACSLRVSIENGC